MKYVQSNDLKEGEVYLVKVMWGPGGRLHVSPGIFRGYHVRSDETYLECVRRLRFEFPVEKTTITVPDVPKTVAKVTRPWINNYFASRQSTINQLTAEIEAGRALFEETK